MGIPSLSDRLAQISRQHNLRDAGSPMSKELEIFPRTRQAIEASTFPLSMALKNHYFKDDPVRSLGQATDRDRNRFGVEEPELRGGLRDRRSHREA